MKSKTKTVIEAATLTPEEREQHIYSIRAGGAVFALSLESAARDKALYAVVDWLGTATTGPNLEEYTQEQWQAYNHAVRDVALSLVSRLIAAGIERPQE